MAVLFVTIIAFAGIDRSSASANPIEAGTLGPIASLTDELIRILEEVEDELERARTDIGTSLGPLEDPTLAAVEAALDHAESLLLDIQDEQVYPSLEPGDAGSADTSVDPGVLPAYATDCLFEVREAIQSLYITPGIDDDYVGSRIKTILYLLPGYREEAGL